MLASYRRLFTPKGTVAFTVTGFLSRLPLSMYGVSTVIMIATLRDSYLLAGTVAAVDMAATVVLVPRISRLIDRYGQARVAVPAVVISSIGSVALVLCAHHDAPDWTLFATSILSTAPNTGGMVRARWAHIYRDDKQSLHTANSFEQVLDEVCFIVGPILAVALCTGLSPTAGVLVAAALTLVGTGLFAAQRGTEPPLETPDEGTVVSPWRNKGLQVIISTFLFTGTIFGSLEVVTVAYTEHLGHESAAGVVLALQSVGSAIAGLLFGLVTLRGETSRHFLLGLAGMAVCMLPLVLAEGMLSLVGLMFVAGMASSPTMIISMSLLQEIVPAGQINEGMAMTTTALLGGIALGSASGGWTIDRFGPEAGYWLPGTAAGLALVVALAGFPRLRSAVSRPESVAQPS
ncbi:MULTISPECIES: MFS transporter [Streptomyces]|uniref:Multidrug resistance protein MdtG n=1 Tax=Streptomyces fradiae ATCC 10745 = DSM 40063 TaxID=1319510 RepID=A0A1Y2NSK7_STRFR|nr:MULTISPECIES: MFS transporter [Streptomyces]OSY50320.1 Multidrug resistance protein MdtG [Streptomyces fradiae ATCC 10745 = DSM 40063]QEV11058.1 MFS transporter [Streptomyces fradiae ATCC 10745 = DSM 40063]UQS29222.1 MFS transporter [Streptomyces fradiae]